MFRATFVAVFVLLFAAVCFGATIKSAENSDNALLAENHSGPSNDGSNDAG